MNWDQNNKGRDKSIVGGKFYIENIYSLNNKRNPVIECFIKGVQISQRFNKFLKLKSCIFSK